MDSNRGMVSMVAEPTRVGLVGFGKMGLLHAGVVNGLEGCELAAVADSNKSLVSGFKQHNPRVAVHYDYEKMLDNEQLDAVFITAPTFLHVPMSLECAKRGIPFFVEKPLGTRGSECAPLIEELNRRPVLNMVGYMARQIDTFAQAKRLVNSGVLGSMIHLKATMYVSQLFKTGKGWRYDKETSGGGVLITQNSHLVDLLQWLFGPVNWVSGQVKTWYSKTVDDFAHAYLGFESGLSGFVDTSWSIRHHRMVDVEIEVHGEQGTLTVSDDEVKIFLDEPSGDLPAGWTTWRKPDLFQGVPVDVGGPEYTRQDVEFLEGVAAGKQVDCDAHSAFRVQSVIDAIYASSDDGGRRIEIG